MEIPDTGIPVDEWGDPIKPAGATSTADWEALNGTRRQHELKRGEHPAESIADSFTASIDRLLEAAPDEHEQANLPGDVADPSAPPRETRKLMTVHGWPKRYVDPIDPEGGEWKASFALASPIVEQGGIVILHGKRGAGKTRMSAEIARANRFPFDELKGNGKIGANNEPKRTALYRTAMDFFVDVRSTYRKNSETSEKEVIAHLASVGLLVLDELQERGESGFEDRLLTHLIDKRYAACLPTILIANLTQPEIGPTLGPSIVDRFHENGRRIEFTWDSYRRAKR